MQPRTPLTRKLSLQVAAGSRAGKRQGCMAAIKESEAAAATAVSSRSFADLRARLQPLDVRGELRRGRAGRCGGAGRSRPHGSRDGPCRDLLPHRQDAGPTAEAAFPDSVGTGPDYTFQLVERRFRPPADVGPRAPVRRSPAWRHGRVSRRYLRAARDRHRRDGELAGLRYRPATPRSGVHHRPGSRLTFQARQRPRSPTRRASRAAVQVRPLARRNIHSPVGWRLLKGPGYREASC